jgi:hypothetical protein
MVQNPKKFAPRAVKVCYPYQAQAKKPFLSTLIPKALQWPNFGHCCFGQVLVIRRCDMIFGEFYGK